MAKVRVRSGFYAGREGHLNDYRRRGFRRQYQVAFAMGSVWFYRSELVYSFLVKYYGTAIGANVTEPLFTITGKDRFGLVYVMIAGEPYIIVDIGMRMLTPRELASCQGFKKSYWLPPKKTHAVAKIGNSVPPQVIAAIVKANLKPQRRRKLAEELV